MREQPLQVSRVIRGFRRRPRTRQVLAAGFLAAAVVSLAPRWWGDAAVSALRWLGRSWLVVALLLVAAALVASGGRRAHPQVVGRRPQGPRVPLVVHVAFLLALAAAVAVAVGAALLGLLGLPITSVPGAPGVSAQVKLDVLKVALAVVGGVGAVVALTVAYRRQRLSEADAHREDTKVLLERYCKAAELLGDPAASVRIAGVYAFGALANDAPDARQGCIDVLCAYLRQPQDDPGAAGSREATAEPSRAGGQERQVRRTITRLIRDNLHLPDDDPRTWRGHDFDFSEAVLDGGDFSGATFTDEGTVTFAGATITGPVSFAGATFAGGTVSFDRARFAGGGVSFRGARFTGGVVDLSTVDERGRPPADALWPGGTPVPSGLRLPPQA